MWRFVLMLLTCTACGGESPAAVTPAGDEVGSYALVSLNGAALPAALAEGGMQMVVRSGSLTLQAGGTIVSDVSFRVGADSTWRRNPLTGSYRRQGNTLILSYSNGGSASATLDGGELHFVNEGVTWLFRKQ